MSREDMEIVAGVFDALERGELHEGLALFDEEVIVRPIIGPVWRGREGVLDMAVDWTEGLANWSMTADEFIDAGNRVVVRVHQTGEGEASGVPITSDYWFVFTVRTGRIVRWDMHADRAEALEAVGLRE